MHTSSQRPATGLQRTEGRSENKMTKVHSGDGFDANQEHPESNGKPKDIEVSSKDTEERSASDSRMLECLADIAGGIQLEVGEAVLVQNLPLALARYNGNLGEVIKGSHYPAVLYSDNRAGQPNPVVDEGKAWVKLPDDVRELPILCPIECITKASARATDSGEGSHGDDSNLTALPKRNKDSTNLQQRDKSGGGPRRNGSRTSMVNLEQTLNSGMSAIVRTVGWPARARIGGSEVAHEAMRQHDSRKQRIERAWARRRAEASRPLALVRRLVCMPLYSDTDGFSLCAAAYAAAPHDSHLTSHSPSHVHGVEDRRNDFMVEFSSRAQAQLRGRGAKRVVTEEAGEEGTAVAAVTARRELRRGMTSRQTLYRGGSRTPSPTSSSPTSSSSPSPTASPPCSPLHLSRGPSPTTREVRALFSRAAAARAGAWDDTAAGVCSTSSRQTLTIHESVLAAGGWGSFKGRSRSLRHRKEGTDVGTQGRGEDGEGRCQGASSTTWCAIAARSSAVTRAQVARLSKFEVPIHPASLARIVWDSFTLLLLFILVIVYPFVAAFDEQLPGAPRDRGLSGLVGLAFSVDVVLNLLTGFRAKHSIKIEFRIGRVLYNYLRSWMLPDILAALAVSHLGRDHGSSLEWASLARGLRLLSMLHMFKTWRIKRILQAMGFVTLHHPFVSTTAAFVLFCLVFLHWLTCAVCFVWLQSAPSLDEALDAAGEPQSRVLDYTLDPLNIDSFSSIGVGTDYRLQQRHIAAARLYLRAWRVAQGHISSHGQFLASGWREDTLTCVASFVGSLIYKVFVSLCLTTFIKLSKQRATHVRKDQFRLLERYFQRCAVPEPLRRRARKYMEVSSNLDRDVFQEDSRAARRTRLHLGRPHMSSEASGLTRGIAKTVRRIFRENPEIRIHVCALPFVRGVETSAAFVKLVSNALRFEVVAKFDTIEHHGETARHLFIVDNGVILRTTAVRDAVLHKYQTLYNVTHSHAAHASAGIAPGLPQSYDEGVGTERLGTAQLDSTPGFERDCVMDSCLTLTAGEFWGEQALLYEHPVLCIAIALTHGSLYSLSHDSFQHLATAFPHVQHELKRRVDNDQG